MKIFLLALVVLAVTAQCNLRVTSDEIDLDDYIKFVKGLLEGMDVKHDMEKILKCIDNVPEAFHMIIALIEKIKHIDIRNIKEVVEIIVQIVGAVREVIDDILPCVNSIDEIKKIIEKLSHIDFNKIIANFIANLYQITMDVMAAKTALENQDYELFGKKLGHVLYMLFLAS